MLQAIKNWFNPPQTVTRMFVREVCDCGEKAWGTTRFPDTVACIVCGRVRLISGVINPVVEIREEEVK